MKLIRVFLLEDDADDLEGIFQRLEGMPEIEVVQRNTIEGAFEVLCPEIISKGVLLCQRSIDEFFQTTNIKSETGQFDLVFLDGCIQNEHYNTSVVVHLVSVLGFTCPIYTTSRDPDYRKEMMAEGCTGECYKKNIVKTIIEYFQRR